MIAIKSETRNRIMPTLEKNFKNTLRKCLLFKNFKGMKSNDINQDLKMNRQIEK